MAEVEYWLAFQVSDGARHIGVQGPYSHQEAMHRYEREKGGWSFPNKISIPFVAKDETEARKRAALFL